MLGLVATNLQHILHLGQLLHIFAIVLQSQLGRLQVIADAEVPSTFGYELEWLTCKTLLAQRLVFYIVLNFAIDHYSDIFVAFFFAQEDSDIGIGSFSGFEAEFRYPVEPRATR